MINKNAKSEVIKKLVERLIFGLCEDTKRDGLRETPVRVARMYQELTSGYLAEPEKVFKTFDSNGFHGFVTVANIDFYSLCEHHLIPFFGKAHIGYVPDGKILGLSKFARLVEIFSHRLQTQENITAQLADTIDLYLRPKGLIVRLEAEHLCVSMRGVRKKGFTTKTTAKRGILEKDASLLNQFYRDIAVISNESGK